MDNTRTIFIATVLVIVGIGGFVLLSIFNAESQKPDVQKAEVTYPIRDVIGVSTLGRKIERFAYGDGDTHLVFIAGIHGGYEWNTVLLAEQFMDHLEENPDIIPSNITVSVIPMANPDGVHTVFGTTDVSIATAPATEDTTEGRFNANNVDLNRNFDCNWESTSFWRGEEVDAGTKAFSEPEAAAIRDFVLDTDPTAVVFWHSAANGVYGATCNGDGTGNELSFAASNLMNTYADAAGYPAIATFDHYEITGDAEGWLAKMGIPSVSVELKTHETVEWEQNLRGIEALFEYYAQ